MSGLSKTLEKKGELVESVKVARECYQHRRQYQGNDDFYTNRNRYDLARLLHKLSQDDEAIMLLLELRKSMATLGKLDSLDEQLSADADELLRDLEDSKK